MPRKNCMKKILSLIIVGLPLSLGAMEAWIKESLDDEEIAFRRTAEEDIACLVFNTLLKAAINERAVDRVGALLQAAPREGALPEELHALLKENDLTLAGVRALVSQAEYIMHVHESIGLFNKEDADNAWAEEKEILTIILDRKDIDSRLLCKGLALPEQEEAKLAVLEILLCCNYFSGSFDPPLDFNLDFSLNNVQNVSCWLGEFSTQYQTTWKTIFALLHNPKIAMHLENNCSCHPLHAIARHHFLFDQLDQIRQIIFTAVECGASVNCTHAGDSPLDVIKKLQRCHDTLFLPFGATHKHSQTGNSAKEVNFNPMRAAPARDVLRAGPLIAVWNDEPSLTPDKIMVFANPKIPKRIVQAFGDINTRCPISHLTMVMIATVRNNIPVLRSLVRLRAGGNINDTVLEWTALHFAAYNGQAESLKVLLAQPHIIPIPRTSKRPWMADKPGLSPHDVALIGAQARGRIGDPIKDEAIKVLEEFFNRRKSLARALRLQTMYAQLPTDLIKMIVRHLRLADNNDE